MGGHDSDDDDDELKVDIKEKPLLSLGAALLLLLLRLYPAISRHTSLIKILITPMFCKSDVAFPPVLTS